jgi:acylphosphatase
VQGVGFRFWAVRLAHSVGGISGYACNLSDGDVVVLMSGDEDKLNAMQVHLYRGPLFARVDKVEDAPELKAFLPPIENGVFKRI